MTIGPPAHIACRDLVEMVTDYLEGALPLARAAAVQAHLAECEGCTAYVEQMRRTIGLAAQLCDDDLPDELRARLLDAYRTT